MPSPKIVRFELEVSPKVFRLVAVTGREAFLGYVPEEGGHPQVVSLPYQDNQQRINELLEALESLLRVDEILASAQVDPHLAFKQGLLTQPAVHLGVEYDDGQSWASLYTPDSVPANVSALIEQCRYLGRRTLLGMPAEPEEPVAAIATAEPPKEGGPQAKVKVTPSGEIRLNGKMVKPDEFREAARQLQSEGGHVLYYRDMKEETLNRYVWRAAIFVLDTLSGLGIPIYASDDEFPD